MLADADPYLSLQALASYSSLSPRKLRKHLKDTLRPIPSYKVGRRIVVRRSDFDRWMARYRRATSTELVDDVLRDLRLT